MIDVQSLTRRRGKRAVVSDVTFRCEPGTVTGFLGPNGAGKTTTMRMLTGLSAPDSARQDHSEAIRCLKRHLAGRIWHLLQPRPPPNQTITPSTS